MALTRKVYEDMASYLAKVRPDEGTNYEAFVQWNKDLAAVSSALLKDNIRFDTGKFLRACIERPAGDA